MHKKLLLICVFLLVTILLNGCAPAGPSPTPSGHGMANPASENCIAQGGMLEIRLRAGLGEYGVCVFEENHECEEWSMFRDECPVGGVDVSGYVTEAAVYCAITGGEYEVTANGGTADEQGTCTLRDGNTCDAGDYFAGECGG